MLGRFLLCKVNPYMVWLDKVLRAIITVPVKWLVNANSIPVDIENELGIDKSKTIIYLLRTHSVTDLLALKMSTDALGLPKPTGKIELGGQEHRSCLYLQQPRSMLTRRVKNTNIGY